MKIHTDDGSSLPNCKAEFQAHNDSVLSLSVCPDYLVSSGNDGKVVIYDLKIAKVDQVLDGFQDLVTSCDFFLHAPSLDADLEHRVSVSANNTTTANVKISLFCGDASGTISIFQKIDHLWKRVYFCGVIFSYLEHEFQRRIENICAERSGAVLSVCI